MINDYDRAQCRQLVENEVSWFNGWSASTEAMRKSIAKAINLILQLLEREYDITPKKQNGSEPQLEFNCKTDELKQPPSIDGVTYNPVLDGARLSKQFAAVWEIVRDEEWLTLPALEEKLEYRYPQTSISARLRDFRKPKFGEHTVNRRRVTDRPGVWEYQVIPNREVPSDG